MLCWVIFYTLLNSGCRNSALGIATGYGLDDRGVEVRVPVGSITFSSPSCPDRFCGYMSPSLNPVNQMNLIYTVSSISLIIILIYLYLDTDLSGGLFFFLDFPSTILYPDFLLSNASSHFFCLYSITLIILTHLSKNKTKQKQIR
jgi:hypothetical protein